MQILLIWKDNYPWDVRVEKIALALTSFGHKVHILARNTRNQEIEENINGINIHRLKYLKFNFLNSIVTTPVFFNCYWLSSIYNICTIYKIDLIIVRDLPLAYISIYAGEKFGIPVIFDMAENYPAMWRDVINDKWYLLYNHVLKNPFIGKVLEKYCLKYVNHILVVVEESKARLLNLGITSDKISIISNTPELLKFNNSQATIKPKEWDNKLILLYEGFINKSRGLDIVIRTLPLLLEKFPTLYFLVVGAGKYVFQLKELSKKMKVEKSINFMGWINHSQLPAIINSCDICVIPHYNTEHKKTTIPNKLFDYMASAKPVIVSDAKPLKRIVEEEKCGIVFKSGSIDSFASVIARLLNNPSQIKEMGENGRKAIEKRYNWAIDSMILKQVIKKFQK